jgi:hypothetical protein
MTTRFSLFIAFALHAVFAATAAFAHIAAGPNGGQYVHIGNFHVEFLPQGAQLRFLISDDAEKAVDTTSATATLTILEKGDSRTAPAAGSGKNMVSATLPAALTKGAKIVISGKLKDGRTFLARFEMK